MKEYKLLDDPQLILEDLNGDVAEAPLVLRKYLPRFLGLLESPTPARYRRWRTAVHEAVKLDILEGRGHFTSAFADTALRFYWRGRQVMNYGSATC